MNLKRGKVVKGLGGLYEILTVDRSERIVCRAKGAFRHADVKLLIGDNVEVEQGERAEQTVISKILPRKNALIRPPLANLDMLFVVIAAAFPTPALSTVDKLIAIAEFNGIEVIPVFTKKDLCESAGYEEIYRKIGYDVFSVSSVTGEGIAELEGYIEKKLTDGVCAAFAGASGVGKSTLLNSLFPALALETGDISRKIERGRHTTRHVEIFEVNEKEGSCGFLADTPGFSLLDFVHFDFFTLDDLLPLFREFSRYTGECRYSDCTHTKESECAIVQAVQKGEIEKSRHECYCELYDVLKKKKSYSYIDKADKFTKK